MKILLVEDEQQIIDFLRPSLEAECYVVDIAQDGETGSFLARTNDYSLIILDYILPKKDGREICRQIRQEGKKTPIIMLTVKSEIADKVELLEIGADDYITKPFSFSELLARMKAVCRRPAAIEENVLTVDNLSLIAEKHEVTRGKKEIYLTKKEFSLLEFLMKNVGRVMTRAAIMEHVWDMNADPFSNTIESHMLNLRKKIDLPGEKKLFYTIPNRGYKIDIKK